MKNAFRGAIALLLLSLPLPSQAAIRVLATTADWGALAAELGGDRVDVYTATTAMQDVHRVEARPSLVARARTADLLIANGADLEAGWLPLLLQESGNRRIQRGAPGYFEAASAVKLIEVPTKLDRSMGDIHPYGNPHIQLDPGNVAAVAQALAARLAAVDPAGAADYAARARDFDRRWSEAIERWRAKAAPLKDLPVVIMHRDQAYLCRWLGLRELAAIEPKPGVPPTAGYLGQLVTKLAATPPKLILLNAYNDPKAANWLSQRVRAPAVVLPFSVGGSPEAKDLFGLYEDTIGKLLGAAQ
ncbi:MAG TPA: zinc ABC transporter substrate-binding protein [Steroidobacteraceae bacterium]|nr:zinc ABC transporter substrate-binding protein [Steroidobacteraceae bacterium]